MYENISNPAIWTLLGTKMIKEMLVTTREFQPTLSLSSYQVYKHLQNGSHAVFDVGEFPSLKTD